jgi:hypothetical protein
VARQRFIHPEIWKDPVFGRLTPQEQVLFIGLFSIADDDGRLNADAAYLNAELFTYKDFTNKKVQTIRDSVVAKMGSVHLYRGKDSDLIALLRWKDFQKPKYPTASKLPPPYLKEDAVSPKAGGTLEEPSPKPSPELAGEVSTTSRRVGLGRDGLDRALPAGGTVAETTGERPRGFKIPNLRKVDAA